MEDFSDSKRIAKVKMQELNEYHYVPISSNEKPTISEEIIQRWQSIINLTAKIGNVPAALIMKLNKSDIEVYLKNDGGENPYKKNEKESLELGLYCETVVGSRKSLLVHDALKDERWEKNPDVKLGMISYYGEVITWPDGEVFGTYCVLDNKENKYSKDYFEMMKLFRENLQNDLKMLFENNELAKKHRKDTLRLKELHHRVKNNFNIIISFIRLEKMCVDELTSDDLKEVLTGIESRIRSISIIHERLAFKSEGGDIVLSEYLNELFLSYDSSYKEPIKFNLNIAPLEITNERVFTLGLLFNELVINSIKHAFKYIKHPTISVIAKLNENIIEFKYSDNGVGVSKDHLTECKDNLGGSIIKALSEQLGGAIEVLDEQNGFYFSIDKVNPI